MRLRLVLVLLLLTGCAGPEKPLDLGFKEVPSNVVLGAQSSPTPSTSPVPVPLIPLPPPPSVTTLPPPPFEVPPPGQTPPPPLPPAPACPTPDLLAAPKTEAPSTITRPPVPAAYLFDNKGTFAVSGADARRGTFPARTLRTVGNVVRFSPGSFSYDVSERIGDVTTTVTYQVFTDARTPGAMNGLYLQKMMYERSDGKTADFTPLQPMLLAALPLVRGATSDQRGVDPQSQTLMTYTTTVEGKARVFACGQPLDTWTIHLTKGTLLSTTQDLQFDSTYQVGTQFGGIVVEDQVAFTGTDGDSGIQRSNRATIATAPRVP